MKSKINWKKPASISECLVLIIGIVAIAYLSGAVFGEVGSVKGAEPATAVKAIKMDVIAKTLQGTSTGTQSTYYIENTQYFALSNPKSITIDGKSYTLQGITDINTETNALNLDLKGGVGTPNIIKKIDTTTAIKSEILNADGSLNQNLIAKTDYGGDTLVGEFLENKWGLQGGASFWGYLSQGVMHGAMVGGVAMLVLGFIGVDSKVQTAAGASLFSGIAVGEGFYGLARPGGWLNSGSQTGIGSWFGGTTPMTQTLWSVGVGVAVAALVFYMMYEEEEKETITYTCYPWDANSGGKYCERCNTQFETLGIPCSEYQCRSLGQGCRLVNENTDEALCVWKNDNDVNYPAIQPWVDVLSTNHQYNPENTINPPDRGVRIVNSQSTSGKIKAYYPLTFGIMLNEPAACKIDYERKNTYDEMSFFFGGSSTLKYNHTQIMNLPGPSATRAKNLTISPAGEGSEGKYNLYVRCKDANENENIATFVFIFEVEDGPDVTAPYVVSTSILNGAPVGYNQTTADLRFYMNEPSECKWSRLDQSYDKMEMPTRCSSSMNAQMLYECFTTLTALKDGVLNSYYFRCKDKATEPNIMQESFNFSLDGTRPLVIKSIKPEKDEVVKEATNPVKVDFEVETSAGYKDGEATCYYSTTGETSDEIQFYETNSHISKQEIYLLEGEYTYYFRCVDLAGNTASNSTIFTVESDDEAPIVTRAVHEESYLKIITNEDAECVIDTVDCGYNFEDGIKMTSSDNIIHFANWDTTKNYYIKCKDENGKEPLPNECSIVVRPSEMF